MEKTLRRGLEGNAVNLRHEREVEREEEKEMEAVGEVVAEEEERKREAMAEMEYKMNVVM